MQDFFHQQYQQKNLTVELWKTWKTQGCATASPTLSLSGTSLWGSCSAIDLRTGVPFLLRFARKSLGKQLKIDMVLSNFAGIDRYFTSDDSMPAKKMTLCLRLKIQDVSRYLFPTTHNSKLQHIYSNYSDHRHKI